MPSDKMPRDLLTDVIYTKQKELKLFTDSCYQRKLGVYVITNLKKKQQLIQFHMPA